MTEFRLKIERDELDFSPREWDNLGTVAIYHRNYRLSDEGAPVDVEGAQNIEESYDYFSLPIYMYDHSGITINTTGFSCPWDSGKVGIIYVSVADVVKEYGEITDEVEESVYRVLRGEIETYDQFLRGEIYCYTVEQKVNYVARVFDGSKWVTRHRTEWEHLESCGGFYDEDECESEGQAILDSIKEDFEKELKSEEDSADI